MPIKHMPGKNLAKAFENEKMPIWERPEVWKSPLAILLVLGYILYGIGFALWWFIKWAILSWISPFSNSKFFCRAGFHKWRFLDNVENTNHYICKICQKTKNIYKDYGY